MIPHLQVFARAASGFVNSMSIYERFLASPGKQQRRRGLAMKARVIVVHDRLLSGELPSGSRV